MMNLWISLIYTIGNYIERMKSRRNSEMSLCRVRLKTDGKSTCTRRVFFLIFKAI